VIIEAGISEVHLAMIDPNPLVSGKGKDELEKNGINVYVGECEEIASEINEAYTKYITTGMPFVTAKFAMSLDGKIATSSGDSKWISNEASRKYLHILRHMTDAIMVGAKTILIDDPHLTARSGSGRGGTSRKQPLRVIVDGRCLISPGARIFSEPGKTLLAIGKIASSEETKAFTEASADLLELPSSGEQIDLERLLRILGEKQITSVLVEGGGMLLGDLFDRGLVDKVIAFVAPIVIGGVGARTPVGGKGVDKVVDSIKLERVKAERFNDDSMISGYVKK
jgi:diaminohydroxyphosphoribosylaminopyrimidine deaminase/5-amino-6-(5-phosphoribosylamino)uracil reductase